MSASPGTGARSLLVTRAPVKVCSITFLALKVLQSPVGMALPHDVIRQLLFKVLDIVICIHNDKKSGLGRHITEMWYDPYYKLNLSKAHSIQETQD